MKILISLFITSILSTNPYQQITNGDEVISELKSELDKLDRNSELTFRAYAIACEELVKRGNYKLADSLYLVGDLFLKYEIDSLKKMDYKSNRAFMRKVQGRYLESLEEYMQIRDYYLSTRDVDKTCLLDAYLAEFYRAQGNKDQVRRYLYDGLGYVKNHDISLETKAYLWSRLASFHSEYRADKDSTIYYANLALNAAESSGSTYVAALSQNELGFMYFNIDRADTTTTFGYYRAAIDNFLKDNRNRDYISVLDNMARNYSYLDQPEQAHVLLKEAIDIAEANNWLTFLDDSYLLMAIVENALGNYNESREYYEKAYYTKQATLNDQHTIEVSELTATYEKEFAEQELQEAELRADENEKALIISILITLFSVIVAGLGLFLFNRFRLKNKKLREQQEIIANTNEELKAALSEKEVLFKELNHRVKNNLTVLSGLVFLQENSQSEDKPKQMMGTLRNRIQAMAMVHEKLYSITSAKEIAFQNYLEELIPALIQSLSKQETKVDMSISCEGLILPIDEAVPLALIFNELITNSLKYGVLDSRLEINIKGNRREEGFFILYSDNGPGINPELEINQESMGLKLIEMLSKQLNGELNRSSPDSGLQFEIVV